MKAFFKSLISFAVAAIAFAACSQDELNTPNANDQITLKFNITKTAETVEGKAILGTEDNKTFLNWENNDKIGTFAVGSFRSGQTTSTESKNNAGSVVVNGETCTLNVQTFNAGSVTEIYSYYPYSAAAGKEKTAAIVHIPESQEMSASGFDADAMPMAGKPVSVDLTTVANTDEPCGNILFSNLGSIINFKIYSRTACEETITSVKYIGENIGGEFTIDLTSIDPESEASLALTAHDPINAITTNCASHPSLQSKTSKDNAIDVYMVVAPGTYANSQVVVTTSAYTYTLNASGAKTYTRSHIKPMYVDIQNGEKGDLPAAETWTKVTSSADFTAGTYYILRGDGAYYVPNGTGNPSCVGYSNGDAIVDGMRWIATDSGSGLVFESYTHEGYYLWTTNTEKANTISVADNSTGANASKVWSFAQCKVGNTTYYTATAGASKYLVSYGTSNWRYYGSSNVNDTNIPAEFYKLDESGKQTPTIAFSNPTTSVNVGESVTNVATITPSSLAVTYSSSNNTVASVDASTGEVTGASAGTATITASFAGDATYNAATAEYEITVVDPNANDGSESKPYTAAEAAALALSGDTSSDVYVVGIVTAITTAYNPSNNNVSFDITDDGLNTSTKFRIYRASAASADDFKVGDWVKYQGTLAKYNTTPEFAEGSTLISQLHAPSFTPDGGNFSGSSQSVTITADNGAEIRYATGSTMPTATTGLVYNGPISVTETTTINAIAVKDGNFTGVVSRSFTKITESSVTVTKTINEIVSENSYTVSSGTTINDIITSFALDNYVTVSTSGEANCGSFWGTTTKDWRLYQNKGGDVTIAVSGGKKIKSITINYNNSNNGTLKSGSTTISSGATQMPNTASVTYTVGNTGNATNGQVRITQISVTYE